MRPVRPGTGEAEVHLCWDRAPSQQRRALHNNTPLPHSSQTRKRPTCPINRPRSVPRVRQLRHWQPCANIRLDYILLSHARTRTGRNFAGLVIILTRYGLSSRLTWEDTRAFPKTCELALTTICGFSRNVIGTDPTEIGPIRTLCKYLQLRNLNHKIHDGRPSSFSLGWVKMDWHYFTGAIKCWIPHTPQKNIFIFRCRQFVT